MNVEQIFDSPIPGYGELDAIKVIESIAKLAQTHDAYIEKFPELAVLEDAIVGEVAVEEPGENDILLLRLLHVISVLNREAERHDSLKIIRANFQQDIYYHTNNNLPMFKGQVYL